MIDSSEDDDLPQLVFDNLLQNVGDNYKNEFNIVTSWNKSRQAIYIIWLLEGEVNNGGFNQFYFNSSGQFSELVPDALKRIGAIKFADLAGRANATYQLEYDKITEHQDGTLEGFSKSYENNPLDVYDDEFYDLYKEENLIDLQIKYIRLHKGDFIN